MDNSEFALSKLSVAVTNARGLELISFATSGTIGLASLFLALATVLPASYLGPVRYILFISTGITVVFLIYLVRRLMRNRQTRLDLLRKWQRETFIAREHVDSLPGEKVRRMIELIQSMEDSDISRNQRYGQFDNEFMGMLAN